MPCDQPHVPHYLVWDGTTMFDDSDFTDDHNLYRLYFEGKNPLEFPAGIVTALSCKWSFLIEENDILVVDDGILGDRYTTAVVGQLRQYYRKEQKTDGNNLGWHKITCVLNHAPLDCDRSHCEVLIKHEIFNDPVIETDVCKIYTQIYTHSIWRNENPILKEKGSFYKNLRSNYRVDMIKFFLP